MTIKTRHPYRRQRLLLTGFASALLCAGVWAGCSLEKNYATLSFFFDGVPNPEAKARASAASGVTADMRSSATYTLHKPFGADQCAECHTSQLKITSRDSSMCLPCHKDEPTRYARMHGPVAAGACLWCHAPHESAEAHLLRKPSREVCAQCHDRTLLSAELVPEHGGESDRSCLDCHSGHGGPASMFLKEGISRPAPGERPAKPQTR